MNIIEIDNLTKTFNENSNRNKIIALDNISLKIEQGIIFGLLGQNGAGKTTLLKILLGIFHKTSGSFSLFNNNIPSYKIKSRIGYLPENHKFPNYLTGLETLRFFGKLSGVDSNQLEQKINELIDKLNMSQWIKNKVKTYSKGMLQRLGLAQALINEPDLIFLDEPTDGVDPIGRKEIRNILLELKEQSKTIFLNSHILSEVELITDRVAILNKGKLILEGDVKELTTEKEEYKILAQNSIEDKVDKDFLYEFNITKNSDGYYHLKITSSEILNSIIDKLRNQGVIITEISQVKSSLEDIFISLVKEKEGQEKN